MQNEAGYDEFASLLEVADEIGVDRDFIPEVTRRAVELAGGQQVSVLTWGYSDPELVFVHGGGQNAHTWDLVALGLGRSAIAVDLPGHGHSSWRDDHDYGAVRNAEALAPVIEQLAPHAAGVVGMSLGGLTTIRLASIRPDLVRRLVIVDVTPGSGGAARQMTAEQRGATVLTSGPAAYPTREEMVAAAVAASPRRSPAAVRRGVVHNSRELPDGTWAWRYDRQRAGGGEMAALWADVDNLTMPVMLVKGGESVFVTPADLAEMRRRVPGLRAEEVPRSGHAVQSDQPEALIRLIADFIPQ
ncbi:MAG TPA: alpha/beta hydrolase [Trebonia sp.]|nr:alpha/beta hydrolase [Trebonia sp.]